MTRIFPLVIGILSIALSVGPAAAEGAAIAGTGGGHPPHRIVSLAPSVTEILFDLGLGRGVIGVTRYCEYPREAKEKARVGGYVDPNYEEMLRLRPDLVILLTVHAAARERLESLGIATLAVDHTTVSGIVASILTIGNACGAGKRASARADEIAERMERVSAAARGSVRPRVLVAVDRNADALNGVYIAGRNTFYDEMISIAGGVNAYGGAAAYPIVSLEGILQMNPQVIVDLGYGKGGRGNGRRNELAQWQNAASTEAVRAGRVYLFAQDYTVIPGPRFISFLEDLSRVINQRPHESTAARGTTKVRPLPLP